MAKEWGMSFGGGLCCRGLHHSNSLQVPDAGRFDELNSPHALTMRSPDKYVNMKDFYKNRQ
jgi:hypothetical protein